MVVASCRFHGTGASEKRLVHSSCQNALNDGWINVTFQFRSHGKHGWRQAEARVEHGTLHRSPDLTAKDRGEIGALLMIKGKGVAMMAVHSCLVLMYQRAWNGFNDGANQS